MFLTLVISSVSSVRIISASSRTASVGSLKLDGQSTTTRSNSLRSLSSTLLDRRRVDQLRLLGRGRGEEHLAPRTSG